MSSSLLLMEPMGGSFGRFLPAWVTIGSRCGRTFCTIGVAIGSGCAAQVVATGGLGLPVLCGPRLACIEFDNRDFLSCCLLLKMSRASSMKPGCVAPRFLLNFIVSWRRACSCRRLPTVFFRWLGAIQNYLPLPYQMSGFGKVWSSLPVIESVNVPTDGANVEASHPW
ncbi:hypothetical protein AAG906_011252 [Vitis piasezkii]